MAKPKKKLLPKDFEERLKVGDIGHLKAVFDICEVNARGGYSKQAALAFNALPDDMVRWLVARGADLSATDTYGETPLHARAGHWQGCIEVLLELGADVNAGEHERGTPLYRAAMCGNVHTTRLLLDHGARVDAPNRDGETPLEYALKRCNNAQIERMAAIAELLLTNGARITDAMRERITRIGIDFEFHRANFNKDYVDASSAALERLYGLFDVPPVPRRILHDGKSAILTTAERWEDRHHELWTLLVPSSGACSTVQGEVIRISGRISDERLRNGGMNWDTQYKQMADAFARHVASGTPLKDVELDEARRLVSEIKSGDGDTDRLCQLAVEWVALNPRPMALPKPAYDR